MEVESAEKNTHGNKIWLVILSVLSVLIIVLIVAIVVAKNLPKGKEEVANEISEEAYPTYETIKEEIVQKMMDNENMSGEEILTLYRTQIENAADLGTKAYLMIDYYGEVMAQDIDMIDGEEVVIGLIEADKILNDVNSALTVWSAAEYYNNTEIANQYKVISEERLGGDAELEYME